MHLTMWMTEFNCVCVYLCMCMYNFVQVFPYGKWNIFEKHAENIPMVGIGSDGKWVALNRSNKTIRIIVWVALLHAFLLTEKWVIFIFLLVSLQYNTVILRLRIQGGVYDFFWEILSNPVYQEKEKAWIHWHIQTHIQYLKIVQCQFWPLFRIDLI